MRIISGRLKGRRIPFNNKHFNNADITPQKVKEALFSIIGNDLSGSTFLELFGGSGQIGFEAYSRGAEIIINEVDNKRFEFIWNLSENFNIRSKIMLFNYSSHVCLRYLSKKNVSVDICFLDPPYLKKKSETDIYSKLLIDVKKSQILKHNSDIIIQHYSKNVLINIPGEFKLNDQKNYGSTTLSFFSYNSSIK
jgi:16S rRNA (guanine966-N2)-methyltransferase